MGGKNSGRKHGHSRGPDGRRSSTYISWQNMIARCTQPSAPNFAVYGGAGITVCDRWRMFDNFLADMGERPEGLTLERLENAKGYEPDNCGWATRRAQANNRKTNVVVSYEGREFTIAGLARHTGVHKDVLRHRITRAGWSVEEAVEAPMQRGRRRDLGH